MGTVKSACEAAGVARRTWYDWMENDQAFAVLVEEAKEDVADLLEESARTRATAAVDGSDQLLMFLLKALRPGKYRDALKIDMVSPIVKDKLRETVDIIRSELEKDVADKLLKRLGVVWQ
jgi:hypothetical protein